MPLELGAALVAFLVVGAWRLARRHRGRKSDEPFQDVPDAPPGAEPIGSYRLTTEGLTTYALDLGATQDSAPERRSGD